MSRPLASVLLALLLASCASSEQTTRSGCLFWSTDCTRLEDTPPTVPLELEDRRPAATPVVIPEQQAGDLPTSDLGRVRLAHERSDGLQAQTDTLVDMFAGEKTGQPAKTVYPLPANCSAPPTSLLRNTPTGLSPGRNSAAAGAYASAYRRCRAPSTWPRP